MGQVHIVHGGIERPGCRAVGVGRPGQAVLRVVGVEGDAVKGGIAVEVVVVIDGADVIVLVQIIDAVVRGPSANHGTAVTCIVVIERLIKRKLGS